MAEPGQCVFHTRNDRQSATGSNPKFASHTIGYRHIDTDRRAQRSLRTINVVAPRRPVPRHAAEFDHRVIALLGEPFETACIHVAGQADVPAECQLAAAKSPCSRGWLGHTKCKCRCAPVQVPRNCCPSPKLRRTFFKDTAKLDFNGGGMYPLISTPPCRAAQRNVTGNRLAAIRMAQALGCRPVLPAASSGASPPE